MNIKLDENIPSRLTHVLTRFGHDVDTVLDEGLQGRRDLDVWQASQAAARFLITQDLDFSDVRRYAPGTHHGLLLVRLYDPSGAALAERIGAIFEREDVTQWPGCFMVLTDHKLRVKKAH